MSTQLVRIGQFVAINFICTYKFKYLSIIHTHIPLFLYVCIEGANELYASSKGWNFYVTKLARVNKGVLGGRTRSKSEKNSNKWG